LAIDYSTLTPVVAGQPFGKWPKAKRDAKKAKYNFRFIECKTGNRERAAPSRATGPFHFLARQYTFYCELASASAFFLPRAKVGARFVLPAPAAMAGTNIQ
jgi:hypothetical protein